MKSDGEMGQGGKTRIFSQTAFDSPTTSYDRSVTAGTLRGGEKSVCCKTRTEFYDKRLKRPLQGQGRAVYQTSAYKSRLEKHSEQ